MVQKPIRITGCHLTDHVHARCQMEIVLLALSVTELAYHVHVRIHWPCQPSYQLWSLRYMVVCLVNGIASPPVHGDACLECYNRRNDSASKGKQITTKKE